MISFIKKMLFLPINKKANGTTHRQNNSDNRTGNRRKF
jgi:hypothetical protein